MPAGHNSGVLLVDLQGLQLTTEEKQLLLLESVAGVVLFSRNYQNREQLCLLTGEIRELRQDLLICVDQEGGRVQRFREGFTRLPPAITYSHFSRGLQQNITHEAGWLMASELLACGVDLCLGPVLDIDQDRTDIVGNRAFGNSPEQVIELASAWIDGVRDAGMSVVIKHFPGHGNVDEDSHLSLPVDHRSLKEIEQSDLLPFNAMISKGVEAVMPAHILFPAIDPLPAGFSPVWLKRVLRQKLGYKGLIISDCLSMEGATIAGDYPNRVRVALDAGCDLLILCNAQGAQEVVNGLDTSVLTGVGPNCLKPESYPDWEQLVTSERYHDVRQQLDNTDPEI